MILSDVDILNMIKNKRLGIKPFDRKIVRENGIDCRLDDQIAHHVVPDANFVMDPTNPEHIAKSYSIMKNQKKLIIKPHEQVLLSTYEKLSIPDSVAGFVELRSTWARHGLSMPPTIIDAGFEGTVTLEVINNAPYSIILRPKQNFAHIILVKLDNKSENAYSGFYSGQNGIRLPKVLK